MRQCCDTFILKIFPDNVLVWSEKTCVKISNIVPSSQTLKLVMFSYVYKIYFVSNACSLLTHMTLICDKKEFLICKQIRLTVIRLKDDEA